MRAVVQTWCRTPRAAPDGSLYSWPDGELVTPDKLAAWFKEDILLRRVKARESRARARPAGAATARTARARAVRQSREHADAVALAEVKSLAETLEVPLTEVAELLADDREDYVPPAALAPAVNVKEGSLFTKGTVDAYIAAVIELWRLQVAHGNSNVENPRGAAVRGFLE